MELELDRRDVFEALAVTFSGNNVPGKRKKAHTWHLGNFKLMDNTNTGSILYKAETAESVVGMAVSRIRKYVFYYNKPNFMPPL